MVIGAISIAIALAHIAFGPAVIPGGDFSNATMDSEDRFYAAMFLGWGAAMIYCSANLRVHGNFFGALLSIFFLGGVARVISVLIVGLPNALFIFLGLLELILPPLLWHWHRTRLA